MRCFSCQGFGHFSGQCRQRGGSQTKSNQWTPYDYVGKPKKGSLYIIGAKRSKAFTLGPDGFSNEGVYVLELPNGRLYVGKSTNIEERISQHSAGGEGGAVCAKGFKQRIPTSTPRQTDCESWERTETLTLMRKHGIGKIRGWFYTSPDLSPTLREHAFQQICEKFDLCRICGHGNHFATQCSRRERAGFFFQ